MSTWTLRDTKAALGFLDSSFSLRLASIPILKALNPKPEALLDSPLPVCGTLLYQTYKP